METKVAQGLSDRHASVLAALRIRLRGSAGKSLEMLEATGDLEPDRLEQELTKAEGERKPSLDDLLNLGSPTGRYIRPRIERRSRCPDESRRRLEERSDQDVRLNRKADQTSSMLTFLTGRTSRGFVRSQMMSRFRSVPSCPALG
jgi:hypothetical protein